VKQRGDVRFKTAAELAAAGYTDEDVTLAQRHYTLLTCRAGVFELLDNARAFTSPVPVANAFGRYQFFETFTRLSGASDVAEELLARRADPGKYVAWDERQGQRARTDWRAANPDPLKPVRSYRNRLVHGRVVPEVYVDATNAQGHPVGQILLYPRLNEVDKYLDWRIAFNEAGGATPSPNFAEAAQIGRGAWELVVGYVESAWRRHLLKSL